MSGIASLMLIKNYKRQKTRLLSKKKQPLQLTKEQHYVSSSRVKPVKYSSLFKKFDPHTPLFKNYLSKMV